jgi:phage tail-like protein
MRKQLVVGGLSAATVAGSMMAGPTSDLFAPTRRKDIDHVGLYNFVVEISGVSVARFNAVAGLTTEVKVIEFQDGDDLILRKRPGRSSCGNITLKKGYLATSELWDWWENVKNGQYDRRSISIVLYDNMNNETRRWNLMGCWPSKWKFADLDGKGDDVLAEEIEFVVEELFVK